ncbi:four helix bundle protein [Dokdonia pacifica]|uniref:Four helix bundle protein n=1 Tax=Dokdonia pacifica TaxID=1627892 RepID=A0A239D973_9FLAO|nr:four helix bundle protein [Dokdonia pacifica]GGG40450.1 four helix bundle protein [Dokdonia pacifica]SNS28411.1 four helix bundle protein [Dokdonia pacifica]
MRDLKKRTKKFTIDCWELCKQFPKSREFDAFIRQLIRSSSSVGANYRAANRAKSDRDFIHKMKIVEEEADESMFWLEVLKEVSDVNPEEITRLISEANELLAITVSSIKTVRKRIN